MNKDPNARVNDFCKQVNRVIRVNMVMKEMSYQDIADITGLNYNTLKKHSGNPNSYGLDELIKICLALNIGWDDFARIKC